MLRWAPALIVLAVAGCSGGGGDGTATGSTAAPATSTTAAIAAVSTTTSTTSTTTTTLPTTVVDVRSIEIELLSSPANATAEMVGIGARATDPVLVDDRPGDVLSFETDDEGGFVLRVWIEDEGAHTVCVADTCSRVYTLAPDAETPEEVIAKIEQAMPLAREYLDHPTIFPEWSIEMVGPMSGTGGTTDPDNHVVRIHRNRGRTLDDYVRTILHEFGHVADFEYLDDAERVAYAEIRGVDPATPWRSEEFGGLEDWGRVPSEDFAEVMVMIWSDGRWEPRTPDLAPVPDAATLDAVRLLVEP